METRTEEKDHTAGNIAILVIGSIIIGVTIAANITVEPTEVHNQVEKHFGDKKWDENSITVDKNDKTFQISSEDQKTECSGTYEFDSRDVKAQLSDTVLCTDRKVLRVPVK